MIPAERQHLIPQAHPVYGKPWWHLTPLLFPRAIDISYNWSRSSNDNTSMTKRKLTPLDQILVQADNALSVIAGKTPLPSRPSPAQPYEETQLNSTEQRHVAGLMRVNHSGEVCAQALYNGQASTAKLSTTRKAMEQAAIEENDHLAWCEHRLTELDSQPSRLNHLWYAMSFGLGAGAGLISDRLSLGFVAATEQQVCQHLENHLEELPANDQKSRAVVTEMLIDEEKHATAALQAGGLPFPSPVKKAMSLVAKLMTTTSYRL